MRSSLISVSAELGEKVTNGVVGFLRGETIGGLTQGGELGHCEVLVVEALCDYLEEELAVFGFWDEAGALVEFGDDFQQEGVLLFLLLALLSLLFLDLGVNLLHGLGILAPVDVLGFYFGSEALDLHNQKG